MNGSPGDDMALKAVLFDLDGVLVSTDDKHFLSWKQLTDEEGIFFNESINHRLRGVPRMKSLEIVLERSERTYSDDEKVALAARKQAYFLDLIAGFTVADLLPGVAEFVKALKAEGIQTAVCSGSRNARYILEKMDICDWFDVIVDGNDVTEAKPSPAVFLAAVDKLGLDPASCLVFEDAEVGIESAINGGMKAVGIGCPERLADAVLVVDGVKDITVEAVQKLLN